jgi:hypothetical protein
MRSHTDVMSPGSNVRASVTWGSRAGNTRRP